jgi:acyl-CoA synthetase (AMP-forming)/AMP-acid ligase II
MPGPVIEHALTLFPHVDFVNAYGLTETSSSIAVLGPDDHREAFASADARLRRRLGSVGRPLPGVVVVVRDAHGGTLAPGEHGEVWVRGEQISGEYAGTQALTSDGWFVTRDAGVFDEDGYLYVEGRLDDVIVRGGENLAPGEIERVLHEHPAVRDAAVVGAPSEEWGEVAAAFVTLRPGTTAPEAELQAWVAARLRSARTPETIEFREALPYSDTGKLLRRVLHEEVRSRVAS